MAQDDVDLNDDDDAEDVNPEDAVDQPEDDIPDDNTNPSAAPSEGEEKDGM